MGKSLPLSSNGLQVLVGMTVSIHKHDCLESLKSFVFNWVMPELYQCKQGKILDAGVLFWSQKLMRSPSVTPAIILMHQTPASSVINSKWESCRSIFKTPEGEYGSRDMTNWTNESQHRDLGAQFTGQMLYSHYFYLTDLPSQVILPSKSTLTHLRHPRLLLNFPISRARQFFFKIYILFLSI